MNFLENMLVSNLQLVDNVFNVVHNAQSDQVKILLILLLP